MTQEYRPLPAHLHRLQLNISSIERKIRTPKASKMRYKRPTVPAGTSVPSVPATTRIWATYPCIYVYGAPGVQPSSLWQLRSKGFISLSWAYPVRPVADQYDDLLAS